MRENQADAIKQREAQLEHFNKEREDAERRLAEANTALDLLREKQIEALKERNAQVDKYAREHDEAVRQLSEAEKAVKALT